MVRSCPPPPPPPPPSPPPLRTAPPHPSPHSIPAAIRRYIPSNASLFIMARHLLFNPDTWFVDQILVCMTRYVAASEGLPTPAGVVFMASTPQTGNKDIVSRYFFKDPILALKITW